LLYSERKWFQYDDEKIISLGSIPDTDGAKLPDKTKQDVSKNLKRKTKEPRQLQLRKVAGSSSPSRESSGDDLNIVELDMESASPL
jgi:hypothetical protein